MPQGCDPLCRQRKGIEGGEGFFVKIVDGLERELADAKRVVDMRVGVDEREWQNFIRVKRLL